MRWLLGRRRDGCLRGARAAPPRSRIGLIACGARDQAAAAPATATEVPYTYTTETGEQYEVRAVTFRAGVKVETGTITFTNGDTYEVGTRVLRAPAAPAGRAAWCEARFGHAG